MTYVLGFELGPKLDFIRCTGGVPGAPWGIVQRTCMAINEDRKIIRAQCKSIECDDVSTGDGRRPKLAFMKRARCTGCVPDGLWGLVGAFLQGHLCQSMKRRKKIKKHKIVTSIEINDGNTAVWTVA